MGATDELFATPFRWAELIGDAPGVRAPDPHVRLVPGVLVVGNAGTTGKHAIILP